MVRYFWDQVFVNANNTGVAVILTDGAWDDEDHAQLLQLTQHMCDEVAAGNRHLMKTVLLALKTDVNENETERIEHRFNELDDYESGTDVDPWDHKWVHELSDWSEIFIEMTKDMTLGVGGKIVDGNGQNVMSSEEFNFGIQFRMPASTSSFTLVLDGLGEFEQGDIDS